MSARTFTCESCGGVFVSSWTEEESRSSAAEDWGPVIEGAINRGEAASVCQTCYDHMTAIYPIEQFLKDVSE